MNIEASHLAIAVAIVAAFAFVAGSWIGKRAGIVEGLSRNARCAFKRGHDSGWTDCEIHLRDRFDMHRKRGGRKC